MAATMSLCEGNFFSPEETRQTLKDCQEGWVREANKKDGLEIERVEP